MARARNRRAPAEFSISFLDVICCGFGAVILLLMITKTVEPQIIEDSTINLEGLFSKLQEQLFDIRGETRILNRDLNAKQEQLSQQQERIAILQRQRANTSARHENLLANSDSNEEIAGDLAAAKQYLSDEMKRLLGADHAPENQLIGGIPVDSEFIIFVIDTSPSMQSIWPKVITEVNSTLNIYPEVKGIQILNGRGEYMFSSYARRWIPDTPSRRAAVMRRLQSWREYDLSNPALGIQRAVRDFYDPGKKISIYVFGDDFRGQSIAEVISHVDSINREDAQGNRLVRIHAVGFPVIFEVPAHLRGTAERFAALMRELTYRNGGTFVALNDTE